MATVRMLVSMISITSLGLCATSPAHAAILRIDDDAVPGGDGSSWLAALNDLQAALTVAAEPGSDVTELWVAAGSYTPGPLGQVEATFQMRSGLALLGGFAGWESSAAQRNPAANLTTLSGDLGQDDVYGSPVWYIGWDIHTPNAEHVVTATGVDGTAVLDGFRITAGRGTFTGGGGLLINGGSPTIANCHFWRNLGAFTSGGGVLCLDASPQFGQCVFEQNWAHLGHGGAVEVSGTGTATHVECDFVENRSVNSSTEAAGGAIDVWLGASLIVDRCRFERNVAEAFSPSGGTSGGYGGAIHHLGGTLEVRNSTFLNNRSNAGGAIWSWRHAVIVNSLFRANQAPEYQAASGGWGGIGGAIAGSAFSPVTITVANCTIISNTATRGAGLRVVNSADGDVRNSILWNNTDSLGQIGPSQIDGTGAMFSCIQNMLFGAPGEDPPDPKHFPDCIDANPLFVNLAAGDAHLSEGSPCIDAGSDALVPTGVTTDLEGSSRFADGDGNGLPTVDMGALERHPSGGLADLNGDGLVNTLDLGILLSSWTIPPASGCALPCPADINDDGVVNTLDLGIMLASWTL